MTERRGIPTTGFEAPLHTTHTKKEASSNKTLPGIGGWSESGELADISQDEIDASVQVLTPDQSSNTDDELEITFENAA